MPTNGPGTFENIALGLAKALEALAGRLHDSHHAVMTLAELGLRMPESVLSAPLSAAIDGVHDAAHALGPVAQELSAAIEAGNTAAIIGKGVQLANAIAALVDRFDMVADELEALGTVPGVDAADLSAFITALPGRLFETILVDYFEGHARIPHAILEFFGVLEKTRRNVGSSDPGKPEIVEKRLRFDRIGALLRSPDQLLLDLYGWGATFDAAVLLQRVAQLLRALRVPITFVQVPGTPPRTGFEVCVFVLSATEEGLTPPGLEAIITDNVAGGTTFELPVGGGWRARLVADASLSARTGVRVQPPATLTVLPPAGSVEGRLTAGLVRLPTPPDTRILLLGTAGGTGLSAERISLDVVAALRWDPVAGHAVADVGFEGQIHGGKLVISAAGADGFIGTILSGIDVSADFTVGFGWTAGNGVSFTGSGGLEVQLPVHVSLGPVDLTALTLDVSIDGARIPIGLTVDIKTALGPFVAVAERIGTAVELSFASGGQGDIGPLDMAFAFRPPSGVGLSVDAGLLSGGGYLFFDPDRGEYAGALSLEFAGFIELNAIGLISTRMPDGTDGFSLLIVITAEFGGGGLQLGYGFTLLAVGGLVGLNRGMDLTALIEGVRTGSIESVMFPKDVIANAPRILSDLGRFFPPEQGTFLIGPMAKIGWGTPTLISVSLGVVVEIPPGTIAILGVLKCVLPSEDARLLVLQINFVGAFEPDKSRLWFFAQLFDSRILTMTIDGGMGLLIAWGDQPDFVLTVGGFHPSFRPPPLPFPVPPRLSVDILNRPGQLIRVSGYFAVTSNTVQFGAKAELRLGFSDFGVEGHLAFDALFRFSPFSFIIEISASVSLKAFGVGLLSIDLRFTLEGPAPWRAHGRGSISLLFFEISADFDITWGEERNTTLPPVAVLGLLAGEVGKIEGWETRLPTGGTRALVTLRTLPESEDLVLHPLGTLFISQRVIPLDVRLDRVGAQRPSDGNRFSVTPATDSGLVRVAITGDKFAMAQFQDMDDATKLSRPAYENQDAGLELAAAQGRFASVRVARRSSRFEAIVIDSKRGATQTAAIGVQATGEVTRSEKRLVSVSPVVFRHMLNGSSTSRSALSQQNANRLQPFTPDEGVQVADQRYVVAYKRNNVQAFPPSTRVDRRGTSTFRSRTVAEDTLAAWVADDPSLAGTLHVLPQAEMVGELAVPNTFTPAGPLPVAVAGTELVLLANRKVLIAGGTGADGKATSSAALFDPVDNVWTPTAALTTARRAHSVTPLTDGRVLVAGGLGANDTTLSSAEIYDPIAATWTVVPNAMSTARSGHSATALSDGTVVIAGGTGKQRGRDGVALSTVEVLAPDGTWSPAKPMTDDRTGHRAVLLDDETNLVLVVGGERTTGGRNAALTGCETYDPTTDAWTPTGDLGLPRAGHQATLLDDGSVVVTGGDPVAPRLDFPQHNDPSFRPDGLAAAERYDPVSRVWQPIADLPGGRTAASAVHLRNDRVLVIGGTGGPARDSGYRNVAGHDPADGTWSTAGSLGTGRWDFAAVELTDGRVLVAGGRTRTAVTAATELFNS